MTAGRAAAYSAGVILAVAVIVVALRDVPGEIPFDETPVSATTVPPSEGLVGPDLPAPVVAPAPEVPVEDGIGDASQLLNPDDRQWNDAVGGVLSDTGAYIDPEYDWGDYSFSPVSEIGEFLDPDAD